jgi:bilin biosynthesis protein
MATPLMSVDPSVPTPGAAAAAASAAAVAFTAVSGANDALFARLAHVNKNLRVKAATELARLPPDTTVPTLISFLDRNDTAHRRAAVQTLGMIGIPAVPALIDTLTASANITVRASCSKALAAVAMYFPHRRQSFPDSALDALESAVVGAPDPVTKLSTIGCLATLACDASIVADGDGDHADVDQGVDPIVAAASDARGILVPGNQRAYNLLTDLLISSTDVALGASVSGALAQVANCGTPERKAEVIACLQSVVDRAPEASRTTRLDTSRQNDEVGDDDEDGDDGWGDDADGDEDDDGFGYVQEMCRAHISQLGGGSPGND